MKTVVESKPLQTEAARARTLGVLGGGQLGRMFVQAAHRLGYRTVVLDPDPACPAGPLSHHHIVADYQDPAALDHMATLATAVTTEFENVPAATLARLASGAFAAPDASAVETAQDRAQEKKFFAECGIACAPYVEIRSEADVAAASADLFPAILKTNRLGYDGKGQSLVFEPADLLAAWHALHQVDCILEKRVPLAYECSVVLARGADGQHVHYPVQRNLHWNGILYRTDVHPDNVDPAFARQAFEAATALANRLHYVGVLCVEFFVLQGGALLANEMAPRPHNSGHYSLDACTVSQFELQVRALARLPLIKPRQHSPAVMLNLLGDLWFRSGGAAIEPVWAQILRLPGCHLHLYGKHEPRPGRKMGHITITAERYAQVQPVVEAVERILGISLTV